MCDTLLMPPEVPYHKSQPLFQKYKSILPTSLTYIVLIGQRLLTLETCCGYWYGRVYTWPVLQWSPSLPHCTRMQPVAAYSASYRDDPQSNCLAGEEVSWQQSCTRLATGRCRVSTRLGNINPIAFRLRVTAFLGPG